MKDWKTVVGAVAPVLATALGGPLAGVAAQAISNAVLGKHDGTPDEVAAAIASGGPDVLLKIKQADNDFALKLKELDIDLEKIAQGDRASARDMRIRSGDWTASILAGFITVGFFGILWLLLHDSIPPDGHDVLLVMIGSLGTAWTSIVSFFYGSSAGSERKNATIARLTR